MARTDMTDMLLFSVQKGDFPYKYKLFFTEKGSFNDVDKDPQVYCFTVPTKKQFLSLELGGIYDLHLNGVHIISMDFVEQYQLSEADYLALLDMRDEIFLTPQEKRHVEFDSSDYSPSNSYYSLKTAKSLYKYEPKFGTKVLHVFLKGLQYAACVLIPIALFVLYIFAAANVERRNVLAPFLMPAAAATALPFMFFLMLLIYTLGESLLLNTPKIKFVLLKKYFLSWAGMKKDVTFGEISTKKFRISAIVTTSLFIIGMIAVFFLK